MKDCLLPQDMTQSLICMGILVIEYWLGKTNKTRASSLIELAFLAISFVVWTAAPYLLKLFNKEKK